MAKGTAQRKSRETANAAQAFADYVAMGPGRSIRKLHDRYKQNPSNAPAKSLDTLFDWSGKFHWQDRLTEATTAEAERKLQEAVELDADTFVETSRILNERVKWTTPHDLDAVVKMRESVRKPTPKGGTSVSVTVTITPQQREIAERIAASRGVPADDVIAEIEAYLQEQRA